MGKVFGVISAAFILCFFGFWLFEVVYRLLLLNRLKRFEKNKDVTLFNSKMVLVVRGILDKTNDEQMLKRYILEAGSVINHHWEKGFETASVNELKMVAFYETLKHLALQKREKRSCS